MHYALKSRMRPAKWVELRLIAVEGRGFNRRYIKVPEVQLTVLAAYAAQSDTNGSIFRMDRKCVLRIVRFVVM